ncbi:E3 ubiquitin-protein ligase rnf213-alpha-like [Mercenaria mercenaria]|uniref:E3 ubiquitin-protein ligase rnf213-alpha-like n=1 Tax=Mercenaria mercenaria TaxID=6596 RepID=UPI00234ED6BB|nr:E3 ubiquitin-protein ligase rnf213-alpha-like [Mercenaria mercenaria]
MSAGEEPMNIARVQCLHTAVTGYAPLIFDLKDDADFEELLQLCRNVWKELEANPSLPDKLKDTARHLQWLDNIQRAHGSVEVTSMMQVEACNEYGEYTIGSNAWPKTKVLQDTTMSMIQLKDILKLTVPGEDGKRETRNYNYENLQDLQSRLMLVAGNSDKGAESVEKFTMIFDGALRLSNVYVKLCSAGCVLFKNWTACFFCDQGRPVCAILEFGETESQLKGRQSETEELKDIIPKLAGFMESCFDRWMEFIKEKRKKYRHLNYFTTDQLVILQRELVKIGTSEEPSHLIYPLLSAVKSDCTRDNLHTAMVEAKIELDGEVEKAQPEEVVDGDQAHELNVDTEIDFINALVDQGFSASLARKAFKEVGPDASDGFEWCMEHADENDEPTEEDAELPQEQNTVPSFTRWNESNESFLDIITSRIKSMKKQG